MANMDRRSFVLAALGGLGGLGLAGCDDVPRIFGPATGLLSDVDTSGLHVRQNIYCLGSTSPDLVAYRNAIATMKTWADTVPTSWLAQANIHGTNSPPPGMLVNLCQHGNFFFLSWHRMYLYYFERIIRCVSGQPTFSLPYWGYSPTGSRDLPKPFRSPADPSNVLYEPSRDPDVNAGVPLSGPIVDPGTALAEIAYNSFSSTLEGTPHGAVHVAVGGLMGFVRSAAQDPIFWLHHAQIDRLWNVWLAMGGGRSNPTDPTWLNTKWEFYDELGHKVTLTGAQVVDTAMQLGYRYAPLPCASITTASEATLVYQSDSSATTVMDPIRSRPPLPDPIPVGAQGPVTLGANPVQVTVAISADGQKALQSFANNSGGGNALVVQLDDISLQQPARVYYEVYADLPPGTSDTAYSSPHYVGNLDFFGIGEQMGAMAMPSSRRLSLLRVYAYLRSRGLWSDQELRLTFVPRGNTETQTPAQRLGGAAQAVVGRVSLRVE